MPHFRQYLLPHRLQETLACCPRGCATYASLHLDTIRKILNHLLTVLAMCDSMLFLSSWGASSSPLIGLNVVLVALLLLLQTALVYMIVNHSHPSFPPTEFHMGIALGITVGGSVAAFVVASAFAHPATALCDSSNGNNHSSGSSSHNANQTTSAPAATTPSAAEAAVRDYCMHRGSVSAVWFWSSLAFWINFCAALLVAVGRRDLALIGSGQYEHIGSGGFDDDTGGFGAGGGVNSRPSPAPTSSFVGDYSQIPEIRSHDDQPSTGGGRPLSAAPSSPATSSSETSRIVLSI